ncbi:hypothetical protein GZ78_22915 [Endozoicomonas numazuensis]|uniref:Uncharacterized protein n=1 Tax=Endozoicomonas numazuensis TaxID=1137799 RepID=A0A081NCE9_9GAMM|nr:hypothetical protein GZ78_22915 [Endozoicomonas numazuensis]
MFVIDVKAWDRLLRLYCSVENGDNQDYNSVQLEQFGNKFKLDATQKCVKPTLFILLFYFGPLGGADWAVPDVGRGSIEIVLD